MLKKKVTATDRLELFLIIRDFCAYACVRESFVLDHKVFHMGVERWMYCKW